MKYILPILSLALLFPPGPALAAGKSQPLTIPDFTKGDAIPAKRKARLEPRPHGAARLDVLRQDGDHRCAADFHHQGGEGFSRRWRLPRRRRHPWSRRQAVFLRPAHRVRQGNHHRRIGGGRRETDGDPLAGGQGGRGRRQTPGARQLQRHRAFDCPKSKRILEQGCKALAEKVAKSPHQEDPIVRSLNALALLASGDPAYLPLVKKEAQWAAGFSDGLDADLVLRLRHDAALRVCAGDRRPVGHAGPAASRAGSRQWPERGRFVGPRIRETRRPPRRLRDDEFSGSAADHFAWCWRARPV